MIQSVDMTETAGMLEARLRLVDRIRRVEHALAREEHAKAAAALMKGHSHELGNAVQILKLSSFALERKLQDRPELVEMLGEMRDASDLATDLLSAMFAATRPATRTEAGPVVSHTVRAAVDLARAAFAGAVELRIELDDTIHSHSTAEELEAIMLAAMLEAVQATRITIVARERVIEGKHWVEILRICDRQPFHDGELAQMFEPHSLLHVVAGAAKLAGGEASLAPGRVGLELAIELPVATAPLR